MGTTQHFVLFEHVTGLALFRVKEFDEITRQFSAHVNAFIKPIAFVHFKSVAEAVDNIETLSNGLTSELLKQFLRINIPPTNSVLGVSEENLGRAIQACEFGFDCVWHGAIREILRVIRKSFYRLTKSLITQPGDASSLALGSLRLAPRSSAEEIAPGRTAESRSRLVVGLARARLQLNLGQHLADTAVIRALSLIDELDTNLTRSASRLRTCYSTHFPELCRPISQSYPCLNDLNLIRLIAKYPSRMEILAAKQIHESDDKFLNDSLFELVRKAAQDSIGSDLSVEDGEHLKCFSQMLLRMVNMRERYLDMLSCRVQALAPNLHALLDSTLAQPAVQTVDSLQIGDKISSALVAARLIANAGSLTRLANMPASRVLTLGASKALFRKSGAVAATTTGLLGVAGQSGLVCSANDKTTDHSMTDDASAHLPEIKLKTMSANHMQPDTVRKHAARLLAAKSSLACRADCFRNHNPVSGAKKVQDRRLEAGAFGAKLGEDVRHQLRVWAEANGVHTEKSFDKIQDQRIRRKKYRKAKRKAWLVRKLSRAVSGIQPSTNDNVMPLKSTSVSKPTDPQIFAGMDDICPQSPFSSNDSSEESVVDDAPDSSQILNSHDKQLNVHSKMDTSIVSNN